MLVLPIVMTTSGTNQNDTAKELHEKALMIQREIVGEENANVPTTYSKLTKKQ